METDKILIYIEKLKNELIELTGLIKLHPERVLLLGAINDLSQAAECLEVVKKLQKPKVVAQACTQKEV